ncbi:hypothetical protein L208DRAFT_1073499, partial [Tricholoma matsutake]
PLIAFQWGGGPPLLNTSLQIHCNDIDRSYHLTGIIYYANQHFTAHIISATGDSWYHDGM